MFHVNRKTEYALLALEHIHLKAPEGKAGISSTREISDAYQIPYALLAKVMQQLANHGFIQSVQGTKGGYRLAKPAETITVAQVLQIFEGGVAVTECVKDQEKSNCPQWNGCLIKDPFFALNQKINELLVETTVAQMAMPILEAALPAITYVPPPPFVTKGGN